MSLSSYKKHHPSSFAKRIILWLQNSIDSQSPKKIRFKLILSAVLIVFFSAILTFWYFWEIPLVSPLGSGGQIHFLSKRNILGLFSRPKIIYGFLPYWNIDQAKIHPELTHLGYFGLNIGENGDIVIRSEEGGTHAGYNGLKSDAFWELNSELEQQNSSLEIVLVQFDPDKIVKLVNDEEAHQNLLTSIDSILLAYPVSGVNIDIEYSGEVTEELRDNFASLIEKVDQHLEQKFDNVQLSIDMYANASNNKLIWDVPRIGKAVDYIVVMAYDFHLRSSPQAGPVAPLFGARQSWNTDIHQNLREYLRYVPNEKILLGVPFYGYEWQTESREPQAKTFPDTGRTASYKRVRELLNNGDDLKVETGWDESALSPYLSYVKDDNIYTIYYENPTSISFKMEYVNQLDLAGIAIWALGYDGYTRELWEVLGARL